MQKEAVMSTMTRRTFGLAAALLGLLSVASTAQATIYYSNPDGSINAVNDDGTHPTAVLPNGSGGATFTQITDFASNNWYIGVGGSANPQPTFATDDSSVTVCVYDAIANLNRFIRIHVPGGDPLGVPVTPSDTRIEVV